MRLSSTTMAGLARATHLFHCFYAHRAIELCREEGISEADIERGCQIASVHKDVQRVLCSVFGRPEYGSWPERAARVRREELRRRGVTEEEIEATC